MTLGIRMTRAKALVLRLIRVTKTQTDKLKLVVILADRPLCWSMSLRGKECRRFPCLHNRTTWYSPVLNKMILCCVADPDAAFRFFVCG